MGFHNKPLERIFDEFQKLASGGKISEADFLNACRLHKIAKLANPAKFPLGQKFISKMIEDGSFNATTILTVIVLFSKGTPTNKSAKLFGLYSSDRSMSKDSFKNLLQTV